jgi:hypothetical protein
MSRSEHVIFICNDDSLVEKVKDSTIKYADKFIININPSPEVCKDLINYKNKKIVQIVNSKKLATDMYFNNAKFLQLYYYLLMKI